MLKPAQQRRLQSLPAMKGSAEMKARKRIVERNWDEVEKIVLGLQGGMLEAYEMLGVALADLIGNPAQADMYMAVIFELLPSEAQREMLSDRRLKESSTVLPIIKTLRSKKPLRH